jgi:hypothetical protein
MAKWEYKVVTVNAKRKFWTSQFDIKAIEEKLNNMAQQGWELVTMEGINGRHALSPVLTFKRGI